MEIWVTEISVMFCKCSILNITQELGFLVYYKESAT